MSKKQSNLSQLMDYAGNHRYLTYLSLLLSAVSAVLALFHFVTSFSECWQDTPAPASKGPTGSSTVTIKYSE